MIVSAVVGAQIVLAVAKLASVTGASFDFCCDGFPVIGFEVI